MFQKYILLAQTIRKKLNFYVAHSKSFVILQTKPRKVSQLYTKTSLRICLGSKTLEKCLISTEKIYKYLIFLQNIREVSTLYANYLKVSYLYIIHSKTSNLYPKLPNISNSSSIHLKSIEFQFKTFVKYCNCKQKIRKIICKQNI